VLSRGVGGPIAAVALQQVGVEAVVYEAHDGPAESRGLFLTLGVNGMRVLRQLGLLDAVLHSDTIPTPALVFSSTTGKRLGAIAWHRGRVGLLGDAAHAVSPSAGQGAAMAMEDALMLASCLRDLPEPQQALTRYEALRRPRAERIVAVGRRRGTYKALKSPVAVALRDLVMPLAFRLFATERSMAWIYDYTIPWEQSIASAMA
jgi:2-polyprenyl-6-methoxyphenol hydroxylase-like FAD-dependent oxidoreductase